MHFQTSKRGVPSAATWITVLFVASLAVTRSEGIPGVRHFPVCRLSRYEPFRDFGMSPKAGTVEAHHAGTGEASGVTRLEPFEPIRTVERRGRPSRFQRPILALRLQPESHL